MNQWVKWKLLILIFLLLQVGCDKPDNRQETPWDEVSVIVHGEEQELISNATITLVGMRTANSGAHYGMAEKAKTAVTDSQGKAQVAYPRHISKGIDTTQITLLIQHPEYAEMNVDQFMLDGSSNPIALIRGGELVMKAVKDGETPASYTVHVDLKAYPVQLHEPTIKGIFPGNHSVYASYEKEGIVYYSEVKSIAIANHQQHALDFDFLPGISLKGQLSEVVPRPVRNGRVQVNMINQPHSFGSNDPSASVHRIFDASIEEDGTFLFQNLPKGYGEIIAHCDGWISRIMEEEKRYKKNQYFDLQQEGQEITIRMEHTAALKGEVVYKNHKPVAGAKVALWPNVNWGNDISAVFMNLDFSAITDNEGQFEIHRLPGHQLMMSLEGAADELSVVPTSQIQVNNGIPIVSFSPGQIKEITIEVERQ